MISRLYWIGSYEGVKKLEWFFKFDLARPTVDGAKFVIRVGKPVLIFLAASGGTSIDGERTNSQGDESCSVVTARYSPPVWLCPWNSWLCCHFSAPTPMSMALSSVLFTCASFSFSRI